MVLKYIAKLNTKHNMKTTFLLIFTAVTVILFSCSSTEQTSNTTTDADTAVLVNDPENNLNASPVNDTTVNDTVHNNNN